MTGDVLELRLPLKPEYLPVLRATTGVIAGTNSFTYDEVIQLRVAVSEVFDAILSRFTERNEVSPVKELAVQFVIAPEMILILVIAPAREAEHRDSTKEKESLALLKGLMDEVELRAEGTGKTVVRMVKYRAATEA